MTLLYGLLAGIVATAALLILLTPHMLYAALGLLFVILGMAAIYFLQGAAFVAVTHVLVYGGGVLILLLFSAMFLPLSTRPAPQRPLRQALLLLSVVLISACLWPLGQFAIQTLRHKIPIHHLQEDAVASLGLQLLGPYGLAFEWTGLILLIALVGAVYMMQAKRR